MVAAGHTEKLIFLGSAVVAPVVERHLERNFHRRRTVRGIKAMPQRAPSQCRQPLRQLDHRGVGETGQNDVFQPVQLILERGVDTRVSMAEQVDPPGADSVQVASIVEVVQPCAIPASDRYQRQCAGFVIFHLGAWMPDGGAAAVEPVEVRHGQAAVSNAV